MGEIHRRPRAKFVYDNELSVRRSAEGKDQRTFSCALRQHREQHGGNGCQSPNGQRCAVSAERCSTSTATYVRTLDGRGLPCRASLPKPGTSFCCSVPKPSAARGANLSPQLRRPDWRLIPPSRKVPRC